MLARAPASADQTFGPWPRSKGAVGFDAAAGCAAPAPLPDAAGRTTDVLVVGAIRLYQDHLSPLKGFKCPSWPSCSGFALRAIRSRGALQGVLMTLDRLLIREHAGMGDFYPLVRTEGGVRYYDPPERNDLVSELPPFRAFLPSLP